MAKIQGTHTCPNCEEVIEWEYIIPININSPRFDCEHYDFTKAAVKRLNSIHERPWKFSVQCKNCRVVDIFEYNEE